MSEADIRRAMIHKDVLGAGAKKRRALNPHDRYEAVMREFRRGSLYSGSGKKVKTIKQARVIAGKTAGFF